MKEKLKKWYPVVVFFCVPILVNCLFQILHLPTANSLGNEDWLDFWGSYIGAVIGCIPALLALHESRNQAKQIHHESLESRRCSVMPVVDLSILDMEKYPDPEELTKYLGFFDDITGNSPTYPLSEFTPELYQSNPRCFFHFFVRNIGLGPAIDVRIFADGVLVYWGEVSTTLDVNLVMMITPPKAPLTEKAIDFVIQYEDVFANKYERHCPIQWTPDGKFDLEAPAAKLIERNPEFI